LSDIWDVIVVGAGPAGSVAAREISRLGRRVLLVDKANFPRSKVCGSCLNLSALGSLTKIGLESLTADCQSIPLTSVRLAAVGRQVGFSLPGGEALSRDSFDVALIEAAKAAGAEFHSGVSAKLLPDSGELRQLLLNDEAVQTRVVIAADGLNGTLLQQERAKPTIREASRIGAGVMVKNYPDFYQPGTIFMAVGSGGYVGLVQVEGGQLDLAAAFDPEFIRESAGLGNAAEKILQKAGFPAIPNLRDEPWRGTPTLTRSPMQLAGPRWFAIGDAAGYVEPFTGEGMAWAIASGVAVAPLAVQEWYPGLAKQWTATHAAVIRSRQGVCRTLAEVLRSPWLCSLAIRGLQFFPALARPIIAKLNKPTRLYVPGVPR